MDPVRRAPINGNEYNPQPPGAFPSPDESPPLAAESASGNAPYHTRQSSRPTDNDDSQPGAALGDHKGSRRQRQGSSKDISSERRPSAAAGTQRVCGKCNLALTGQFVRALENTYHLDCFTCNDCGKVVASKFFPVPDHPPNQYPLCETDYFKRLNLICHECGGALRGSYITALERKYHVDHFTCSVCPTVFGAQDSYYEHEGHIFCHYHYSTKFAQRCNGCSTAILKQFVEIYRNGVNQHWHPECYMIHKYWNVRLHNAPLPAVEEGSRDGPAKDEASEDERKQIRLQEEKVEEKVLWIWRTLSAYEEKSAGCISDMLLHVSNGAYVDGVMAARRFIQHVDLLFSSADKLDFLMVLRTKKGLSYSREAKLLCKKVVAFFQLLASSQDTGVRRLGVTQELLSLVTGLAHYLKLLIRICLQGALKFERESGSEEALHVFLDEINSLETKLHRESLSPDSSQDYSGYVNVTADTCAVCQRPVEDRCYRHGSRLVHPQCMTCSSCQRDLSRELEAAKWSVGDNKIVCSSCTSQSLDAETGFTAVTRLQQYIHLLKVAHARLLATLRTSGALPHTSDDPNLANYDSSVGHRPADGSLGPPLLGTDARSKSYGGSPAADEKQGTSFDQTLGDIRRLKSVRMEKQLSTANKWARTSTIIGPGGDGADAQNQNALRIVGDRDIGATSQTLPFGGVDKLQLDDIPRLVAAEQAKEQRPNANRYARGGLIPTDPKPKIQQGHRRDTSGGHELDKALGPEGNRPKKYFGELTALEYFIVRHVAVLSMEPLLEGHYNQEELLDLIEMRKPTFWGKFGKAFQKGDKSKAKGKVKGTFGVALDVLVERDGTESQDGVCPGSLRIPSIMQDALTAMRGMDMSMEGIFRKNGNIRRLKEVAEAYDTKGGEAVELDKDNPVQVAALLKKFLRELPDPVMTHKLHRLFITSQKIADEEKRRRILHLSICLLPKSHRDTLEVLFNFLNWAASFSVVDEESGSKMDVHNLATVIAPNILISDKKVEAMEDSFLAIEAVHSLILCNDVMCEVPEDLQSILDDSTLFSSNADITTKEILKRYGDIASKQPTFAQPPNISDSSAMPQPGGAPQPIIHRVDSGDIAMSSQQPQAYGAQPQAQPQTPGQGFGPWGGGSNGLPPPSHNGFYANMSQGTASRDSFGYGAGHGVNGQGSGSGSPARFASAGR